MKRFIVITVMLCTLSLGALAWTNWRFYIGGMAAKGWSQDDYYQSTVLYTGEKLETQTSYNIFAGMDIQFSLGDKFYLETGINYRRAPFAEKGEWIDSSEPYRYVNLENEFNDWLSLPFRFGYRLHLNDENSFEFGIGPYVSYAFKSFENSPINVGISPVVTYKHRALSLSLRYETPVIYDGLKNYFNNQFAFTIGVNFNGRSPNWDNIARGLEMAGGVMGGVSSAMYGTSSTYTGSSDYSYNGDSSYGSSTGSGSSSNTRNETSGGKAGLSSSELIARNNDHTTYGKIESNLIKALNGDDNGTSVSEYRSRMRRLRTKWEKKGYGWTKSKYE